MIKRLTRIVVLCLVGIVTCQAGTVTTRAEPMLIQPGESFRLILELDENAPSGLPNLDPLSHDFYITGRAHSTSYLYVNGKSQTTSRWEITLVPKYAGKVTVPAIQIGQARSKAITIKVSDEGNKVANKPNQEAPDRAVFIQTQASNKSPYLNQQVIYTIKIYHQASLLDAAYQPPQLTDALVIPLGQQKQYQVMEYGEPYMVEEQNYAFFPQKTGAQVLFPPKLQALIYEHVPRRVQASGQALTLDVKSIPESIAADTWLPAKRVELNESYDADGSVFDEGHTLTRTIHLKATGLPAELLPPIEFSQSDAFNTYQEQPERENSIDSKNIVGRSVIKVSYLLHKSGKIVLPEQKITWFNTETNQIETATLPEKTLNVQASGSILPTSNAKSSTPKAHRKPLAITKHDTRKYKYLAAFSLLLAAGYGVFALVKRPTPNKAKRKAKKLIQAACLNNNAKIVHQALVDWAKLNLPQENIPNLESITTHFKSPELSHELQALSKALFDPSAAAKWKGQALWHAFSKACRTKSHKPDKHHKEKPTLPPINP